MLRSDFLPVVSSEKTSIPKVPLPWVLGCLLHPHPAQKLRLPLRKELCNAEVAHLHRVATEAVVWVSHPACRSLAVEELLIFLLPTCRAD